jgi:hypothetical protein
MFDRFPFDRVSVLEARLRGCYAVRAMNDLMPPLHHLFKIGKAVVNATRVKIELMQHFRDFIAVVVVGSL